MTRHSVWVLYSFADRSPLFLLSSADINTAVRSKHSVEITLTEPVLWAENFHMALSGQATEFRLSTFKVLSSALTVVVVEFSV